MAQIPQTLVITGLQKSGTTLLHRTLQKIPGVENPVSGEGKEFWGDDPPFSPAFRPCGWPPAGEYVREIGHVLLAKDCSIADLNLLRARLQRLATSRMWVFKNPYHIVRLSWLKKAIPWTKVVVCVRNPVSNVYSLLKKYYPHRGQGEPPDMGWWGVKPARWASLLHQNKVLQVSKQWTAVYSAALENEHLVDHWIEYADFCSNPSAVCALMVPFFDEHEAGFERFSSADDEFYVGAPLLSRNRFGQTDDGSRIEPLSRESIDLIWDFTLPVWKVLKQLSQQQL
jgi:hypothetical protein